jgi:hypothetical protein
MSTLSAEDWLLDAITDVLAGELTFVASAAYKFNKADWNHSWHKLNMLPDEVG